MTRCRTGEGWAAIAARPTSAVNPVKQAEDEFANFERPDLALPAISSPRLADRYKKPRLGASPTIGRSESFPPPLKEMTVSENPPQDCELLALKQQAFLLDQLNSSRGGQLSRTDANKRIPKQIQEELALAPSAANDLRTALVSRGFLTEQRVARSVSYTITAAGQAWVVSCQH